MHDIGRMTPRVLIIGGGIGGLCLAHGLRADGVDVTVFERTIARTDWLQGYRIHIDPNGSTALHDCLAPPAWARFVEAVSTQPTGMTIFTEHLRRLATFDDRAHTGSDPARQHHGISRIALREALLTGLDGVVRFGAEFTGYELTADGRVLARFTDGSTETGDLLVGADGGNSRVRSQLLPHAGREDIGVTAIVGKYRLTPESRAALPAALTSGTTMVLPRGPGLLFTAVWLGDAKPLTVPDSGLLLDPNADYTFWGFNDAAARLPDPDHPDPAFLRDAVLDRIAGWDPGLQYLVKCSDLSTVAGLCIRSATPVRPWRSGPVTLLGDAIHSMTPMAGIGANTALRDAALLRRLLGERPLDGAVAAYERQMLRYGFAAVRTSLRNARLASSGSRLQRAALRSAFRVAGATFW